MKSILLILIFPLFVICAEANDLSRCENLFQTGRFVSTLSCLHESLIELNDVDRIERKIAGLNQWMDRQEKKKRSYVEKYYFSGYRLWRQHHFLAARNEWVRFLAHARLGGHHQGREDEVGTVLLALKDIIDVPELAPIPKKKKVRRPKKSRPRYKAKKREPLKNESVNRVSALKQKARLAIRSGQFPLAVRLYQMVLNIDPNDEEALQKERRLAKQLR